MKRNKERVGYGHGFLMQVSPLKTVIHEKERIAVICQTLIDSTVRMIKQGRGDVDRHADLLTALNPMDILKRGYSITRSVPDHTIIRNARQVKNGQPLEILLGTGQLQVSVDDNQSNS